MTGVFWILFLWFFKLNRSENLRIHSTKEKLNDLKTKFEKFKIIKGPRTEEEFYDLQENLKKLNKLVVEFDQIKYEVRVCFFEIFCLLFWFLRCVGVFI